ncbi:MAG: CBS domain-containing protein [Candidatus Norongarragalinales archaeon]
MKTVKEVMRSNVPSVSPDDTLKKASQVMKENNIAGVPVVEDRQVVGILTDGDMLNAFYLNVSAFSYEEKMEGGSEGYNFKKRVEEFRQTRVGEIMTPHPRTINENAGIDEAAGIIKRFKVKRLIVVNDKGEPVGLVERLNVVNSILLS